MHTNGWLRQVGIVKLPSGNWRAQVRRKGKYISNTFRRRADADAWALETERTIDKGIDPKTVNLRIVTTFSEIIGSTGSIFYLGLDYFETYFEYHRLFLRPAQPLAEIRQ